MKEVKLKTSPVMLENKNIRTIDISLIYPILTKDEDICNYEIMASLLNNHSGAYPNEKDFSIEVSKRLILHYRAILRYVGENLYIRFDISFPESGITPEYSIEEAIKFFKDTIYHPMLDGDKFDKKAFEREREYDLARLNDKHSNNIYAQSFYKLIDLVDPTEEVFMGIESNLKYLKGASAKRSYELYKEAILNNDPLIYVFGNYNEEEIKTLLKKYFPSKNKEIRIPLKYDKVFHPIKHEYFEETSKFNQTALFMLYDVVDFQPEEKEYLTLIANILGENENDLIFKTLRLNNNLVYSSSVTKYTYNGLMLVKTHLKYENKDQAITLIKESIESLKNGVYLEECLKKLLKGLEVDRLRRDDSKYGKMDTKIDSDLHFRTLDHIYESYKKMKIEDILAFLSRVELNTVYVLRGENND